ncbi:GTP 3',8-cyclase MoaA [Zophobihabitans entericus]
MPPDWKGVFTDMQLIDNYQRRFRYLRLSVTERCNFQCQYCLPDGYQAGNQSFLSFNELENVVKGFVGLGINKLRLTGGEPTLRRDFTDLVAMVSEHSQIKTVAVTTNGYRVLSDVHHWQAAGLNAINISVDSLSANSFALITGQDKLKETLAGVERALEVGIPSVKINTVLLKGLSDKLSDYLNWIKDRKVSLRFIELMETGESATFFQRYHTSGAVIEKQLIEQGWLLELKGELDGPAKVYSHPDYQGKIGLIMPYSKNFCQSCNRLRVSSSGKFHFCLFGNEGIDIRDLLQNSSQSDDLKNRILHALERKPESHFLQQHQTGVLKNLSQIGG